MITQEYFLDMIPDKVRPLVMVSQYDTARQIKFHLLMNGEEYTPSSVSLKIGDDSYSLTKDGSSVYFTIPSSITSTAQKLMGEVVCDNMGSLNFDLVIDPTPILEVETQTLTLNRALSIVLGKEVTGTNEQSTLDLLLKGE